MSDSTSSTVAEPPPGERPSGPPMERPSGPSGCEHCASLTRELQAVGPWTPNGSQSGQPIYNAKVSKYGTYGNILDKSWFVDNDHFAFQDADVCICKCHDAWKILQGIPIPYTQAERERIEDILRIEEHHRAVRGWAEQHIRPAGWQVVIPPDDEAPTWDTGERPS